MNAAATWKIDETMILGKSEIATVMAELKRKARRSVNTRQNMTIFRLAACCGLRVSEVCGLNLGDVRLGLDRPYINIRKAIGKGRRSRRVPLWWDRGTLDDLAAWKVERREQDAASSHPFVCSQAEGSFGRRLDRRNARMRFISSCDVLGPERRAELTIHNGRHSFVSHALAGGRSLAEVRDATGHSNVAITSVYTHVATDDDGEVGDLFDFSQA